MEVLYAFISKAVAWLEWPGRLLYVGILLCPVRQLSQGSVPGEIMDQKALETHGKLWLDHGPDTSQISTLGVT